jgi:hypothetical protein
MPTTGSDLKHFRRIASGVDVADARAEILANRALWYADQQRQQTIGVQAETNNIALRQGVRSPAPSVRFRDCQEVVDSVHAQRFPKAMTLLKRFADEEEGELARAMLVRLRPQGRVFGHIDTGVYYDCRDRYHLVVHSQDGSEMTSGGEKVVFREGELWCFDNKAFHEAANYSNDWRVHIIFDLRPVGRPLHFRSST